MRYNFHICTACHHQTNEACLHPECAIEAPSATTADDDELCPACLEVKAEAGEQLAHVS